MIWFSWVLWHMNHLKLQILFIHIKYMIYKHILLIMFLNKTKPIICTQLNGFKYRY